MSEWINAIFNNIETISALLAVVATSGGGAYYVWRWMNKKKIEDMQRDNRVFETELISFRREYRKYCKLLVKLQLELEEHGEGKDIGLHVFEFLSWCHEFIKNNKSIISKDKFEDFKAQFNEIDKILESGDIQKRADVDALRNFLERGDSLIKEVHGYALSIKKPTRQPYDAFRL